MRKLKVYRLLMTLSQLFVISSNYLRKQITKKIILLSQKFIKLYFLFYVFNIQKFSPQHLKIQNDIQYNEGLIKNKNNISYKIQFTFNIKFHSFKKLISMKLYIYIYIIQIMDQQDKEQMLKQIKSYGEWIELGKQNAEPDREFAVQCYEKALELTEDKYEPYFLIGNIQSFTFKLSLFQKHFPWLQNQQIIKIDRLIAIAWEYERIQYDSHAKEIHGWIKELDPTYDHEVPKTYDDYQEIFGEYLRECRTINRLNWASKSIDKMIELSENKIDELIYIGKEILIVNDIGLANLYFDRALSEGDKYDVLMKIGDSCFKSNLFEACQKYFQDAYILNPNIFQPQTKIIQAKLKLQQFQEALDYINKLVITQESYIKIGLLLSIFEATLNEGQVFLFKGVELSFKRDSLSGL
ncbi:hypothetical protein pb186bvf_018063 [Paramecium bursaria]